ncbi:hypothetical protein ScPMuIL_010275 [Solemya velum]
MLMRKIKNNYLVQTSFVSKDSAPLTWLKRKFRSQASKLTAFKFLENVGLEGTNTHVKRFVQTSTVLRANNVKKENIDLQRFPVENIRNFSIIAHVDHGKSTLADRLLEITNTISKNVRNLQVLDRLQVERERGITVKAQTASLFYNYNDEVYLLNLVDTPGHVDFNYEVSRSLSACQGVILLVDANQGVQAQTVANFYLAFESNLTILPVMNKIDLKVAKPDVVLKQLKNIFDIKPEDVLKVSAKNGTGVEELLRAVVEKIPPPPADLAKPFRGLMFDSWYDQYKGAVANVAICDGVVRKGDKIQSCNTKKTYEVQELGIMHPTEVPTGVLFAGQVGYIIANMKNVNEAQVGDTLCHDGTSVEPLPGFKPARAMVFAGVYPSDHTEFSALRNALNRLTLNDSSVSVHVDHSPALGQGWRLGFLGLLHMDVFNQRLEQEYDASVIVTAPNVPYKARVFGAKNLKKYGGEEVTILNPCHLPDPHVVKEYLEPMVIGTILFPDQYLSSVMNLCMERRGEQVDQVYIDDTRLMFKVILPLSEIVVDFFDDLKSITSGFASFDYEDHGYQVADLVKVNILLNSRDVEELTLICHRARARVTSKQVCSKLKETIPRQLFKISIQAAVGSKFIAREDIPALKKDVLAKCYGGDISRKMKLLKRQAEGKKRMRKIGNIDVPKDAFIKVLKR